MSTQVMSCNNEQAQRAINLCWRAELLMRQNGLNLTCPVTLVGETGTGKTTCGHEVAAQMGVRSIVKPLPLYADAGDMFAIPVPNMKDRTMQYLGDSTLPWNTDEAAVIIGDEVDRCTPEIMGPWSQFVLGRSFHGLTLSPNSYVMMTMNGASDIYTTPLSEQLRSRMCFLYLTRDAAGRQESYEAWALTKGISARARTFKKFRRDAMAKGTVMEDLAVPNDRTVDVADFVHQSAKDCPFQTGDILPLVLQGLLGVAGSIEWAAIDKLISEAPTVEDVLGNPTGAMIPENASVLYALVCVLQELGKDSTKLTPAKRSALATYGSRLRPEMAAALFRPLTKSAPVICTDATFQAWAKKYNALLMG